MRDWIDKHWGDWIGVLILYTGVAMMFVGAFHAKPDLAADGRTLVAAALIALKLRSPQPANGAAPAPSERPQ